MKALTLVEMLARTKRFYEDAGARLAGELLCKRCGHRQACSAEQAGRYLGHGWPQHCGETMELQTRGQQ